MTVLAAALHAQSLPNESGYKLWLRYAHADAAHRAQYKAVAGHLVAVGNSPTQLATEGELRTGLDGLLNEPIDIDSTLVHDGSVVAGTPKSSRVIAALGLSADLAKVGN